MSLAFVMGRPDRFIEGGEEKADYGAVDTFECGLCAGCPADSFPEWERADDQQEGRKKTRRCGQGWPSAIRLSLHRDSGKDKQRSRHSLPGAVADEEGVVAPLGRLRLAKAAAQRGHRRRPKIQTGKTSNGCHVPAPVCAASSGRPRRTMRIGAADTVDMAARRRPFRRFRRSPATALMRADARTDPCQPRRVAARTRAENSRPCAYQHLAGRSMSAIIIDPNLRRVRTS